MTAPRDVRDRRRRPVAYLLTALGILILGADLVISAPMVADVLRDPSSHAAQDAGMAAILLLLPLAAVGILCLGLGYALWGTRAGGVLLLTALAVVAIVSLNLGGLGGASPLTTLLWIGVALAGTLLAAWFAYRDWKASRAHGTAGR